MHARQQGITAIGFVVLLAILGVIGFAALKLTPVYLEHMKVVSLLNDVKADLDGQNPSIQQIRSSIGKRINIEMITAVKTKDFDVKKTDAGYQVGIQYENRTPYLGNLYLVASFDNEVEIRR